MAIRARAFGVHIFTALGGAIALIAMLEAVREHWAAMFGWLGVALIIDGLDGPLARRFKVEETPPNWSGDTLDLVIDFLTYVFIPAYAITASGLLIPLATPLLGAAIVISGSLYFADRRMKTDDNHFRGFPALWNAAAFLSVSAQAAGSGSEVSFSCCTRGLDFRAVQRAASVRTTRLRKLNLALIGLWAILAIMTVAADFVVPWWVTAALCAIGVYILFIDTVIRMTGWNRA